MSDRVPTVVSVQTNTLSDERCATLHTSYPAVVDAFLASGARHAYARVAASLSLLASGADLKQPHKAAVVDAATQTTPSDRALKPDTSDDESMSSQSPQRAAVQQEVQEVS